MTRAAWLLLLVLGCADEPKRVTIIATTDFHGALDEGGGAEQFAGAIARIRSESRGTTFLIDAGDLFSGTMISNLNEGAPVIEFYNRLGVDAAAVGNHEFDYGPVGQATIATSADIDARGAVRARAAEAHFPFLAANIDSPDAWYRPSVILKRDGIRVGVVGATSMSTPSTTIADNLVGMEFVPTAARVLAEAERLRKDVDFLVLTIHDGGICSNDEPVLYPLDETELGLRCEEMEIFDILRQIPAGTFDAVVAGHTHRTVIGTFQGTALMQPPAKGKGVAYTDLTEGRPPSVKDIVRGNEDGILADANVAALLLPYRQAIAGKANEPLGIHVEAELTRDFHQENALGNLIADMLRDAASTEVAIINNGGLRVNLAAGPITYGGIYNILPFDNSVAVVSVTGPDLVNAVELGLSGRFEGYSWSNVTRDAAGVRVGGEPVDLKRTYQVAFSDFLASGGSGFNQLHWPKATLWLDRPPMRELVVAAIKKLATTKPEIKPATYFDAAAPRLLGTPGTELTRDHR